MEGKVVVNADVVIKIGEKTYSTEMVRKFMSIHGKSNLQDFPREWLEQHMTTFNQGYDYGYEEAQDDAPDCDNCERVNLEDGPPEGHYSNWER